MKKLVKDGSREAARSAKPVDRSAKRRRFTLSELLQGAEQLPVLYAGVRGALDGPPVGAERG